MAFPSPSQFAFIGPEASRLGERQIAFARPVGGGATADGQDEVGILLDNAAGLWNGLNLQVVSSLETVGDAGSPPTPMTTTTSASFVEVARVLVNLGPDRLDLTVDVDFEDAQIRLGVYNAASDTLIGSTQTSTSSAARTQERFGFNPLTASMVYVKVEALRNTTTAKLFGVRCIEGAALNATNASYGFKKVDDARAAGDTDLSALYGLRVVNNTDAARKARGKRWGQWWPADDSPQLAACPANPIAYPLGLYRPSAGGPTLKAALLKEVKDAAVNVGLVAVPVERAGGLNVPVAPIRLRDVLTDQLATTGGALTTTTLTGLDFEARAPGLYLVYLVVSSELSGVSTSQGFSSGTSPIGGINIVEGLSSITFTAGKAWQIDFDIGGSGSPADGAFPGPRLIARQTGTTAYVWPAFDPDDYLQIPTSATPAYTVTVEEIGQLDLRAVTLWEEPGSFADAVTAIESMRPGRAVRASAFRALYRAQRDLFLTRGKVFAGLPGYDPGDTSGGVTRCLWGSLVDYEAAEHTVASVLVGDYGEALDQAGSTLTRSLRVSVAYQIMLFRGLILAPDAYPVQWSFELGTWNSGAGDWSTDALTLDVTDAAARGWALERFRADEFKSNTVDLTAPRVGTTNTYGGHRYTGGTDVFELGLQRRDGVQVMSVNLVDTSPATRRLLTIKATGYNRAFGGATGQRLINPHDAQWAKIRVLALLVEEDPGQFDGGD